MAFYIEMDKIVDSEQYVEYSFGREDNIGVISLDKVRGSLTILSECPLDQDGTWSERVGLKLAKLWTEGVYPENTQWAS